MSELSEAWFEEAKRLEYDHSLMIQVSNKKEQRAFSNELEESRQAFALANAVLAAQFVISGVRRDGRFWVVVTKKQRAPLKGLIRKPDGKYEEVQIDPQRRRMLTLMIKDGLPRSEIEDLLGGITEEEEQNFFAETLSEK